MSETFKFITGDSNHNMSEVDRLTAELESRHPGCTVNITHEVNDTRVKIRFTLGPLHSRGSHEAQMSDYELTIIEADANQDLGEDIILKPADEAIRDYEMGDRL